MEEGKAENKIHFDSILIKDYDTLYLKDVCNILKENFKFPWSEETINQISSFSYKKVYILKNDVIGFLDSKVLLDEAEILLIAVSKKLQGNGLGKFILNRFLKDMKNYRVKVVYLEVAEDNLKAINLYKSFGFEKFGIRCKYYKDDKNAILMKKFIT